jgi:hypothetical protein
MTKEVYLAIYDLSHGMARNMSAQFLGPDHVIDMIPHTGIVVFGKEYFFGGGIQAVEASQFRRMSGMQPVQTQRLGWTTVSSTEFDAWCQQIGSTNFSAQTYDLLHCNCNHFSDAAALQGLKLSQGVPEWILQVPQRFLSSPMGQMIRPMLEQMQVTTQTTMATATTPTVPAAVVAVTRPTTNPWAELNAPTPAASTTTTTTTFTTKSSTTPPPPPRNTPQILKKFTQPMISNDTKALSICVAKLKPHLLRLDDYARDSLDTWSKSLQQQQQQQQQASSSTLLLDPAAVSELWRLLKEGTSVSFCLLLLRLVVLEEEEDDYPSSEASESESESEPESSTSSNKDGIEWMVEQFESDGGWKTPAARSLAWCVVSNYYVSHTTTTSTSTSPAKTANNKAVLVRWLLPSTTVEAAIRDWNHETREVRQAACTFLYNFALREARTLDEETMVSLVCSSLECLVEEPDATTRLRRLVVGARVVFPVVLDDNGSSSSSCNEIAKDLVQDLGFVGLLQELAADTSCSSIDAEECRQLATELIAKFQ